MTKNKIREVLNIYGKKFEELGVPKKQFSHDSFPVSDDDYFAHCHEMLNEIELFIQKDRTDKAFRWIGFIQGCLWRCGIYTIEELKNHNKPT
jgi:hypothetical protein